MSLINKEKVLNGVGKAVDVTNKAADKASSFVKEKEIVIRTTSMNRNVGDFGIQSQNRKINRKKRIYVRGFIRGR